MTWKIAVVLLLFAIVTNACSAAGGKSDGRAPDSTTTDTSPAGPGSSIPDPRVILAAGRLDVEVMTLRMSPRAVELGTKLQRALAQDPEFLREHMKKSVPGEPLPYDERFGLTKAEYEEFLATSQQMSLQKIGDATLAITETTKDSYRLDGGTDLPELTGIVIDLGQDEVRTQFATAAERIELHAPAVAPLGTWSGVQWKHAELAPDQKAGTMVQFSLGRADRSGRGVLHYEVRVIAAEGNIEIMRILTFDVPAGG